MIDHNEIKPASVTAEDMAMLAAQHDIPLETSEAEARTLSADQIASLNATTLSAAIVQPDHIADTGKLVPPASQSCGDEQMSLPELPEPTKYSQWTGGIGEAGTMPGTTGFTMACFNAIDVPLGTKLYATPQPSNAVHSVTDTRIIELAFFHGMQASKDFRFRGSYQNMPLLEREEFDRMMAFAHALLTTANAGKEEKS